MPLRSGKEYRKKEYRKKEYRCKNILKKIFPTETQPFNMVLLPEKSKQYVREKSGATKKIVRKVFK